MSNCVTKISFAQNFHVLGMFAIELRVSVIIDVCVLGNNSSDRPSKCQTENLHTRIQGWPVKVWWYYPKDLRRMLGYSSRYACSTCKNAGCRDRYIDSVWVSLENLGMNTHIQVADCQIISVMGHLGIINSNQQPCSWLLETFHHLT